MVALAPHNTLMPQFRQFTSQVQHIVLYAAKYMDTAATDKYNLHNKKIWNENPIEDIKPIEKDKYFILENIEKKQPQENEQEENPKRTLFKKLILLIL